MLNETNFLNDDSNKNLSVACKLKLSVSNYKGHSYIVLNGFMFGATKIITRDTFFEDIQTVLATRLIDRIQMSLFLCLCPTLTLRDMRQI